MTHVLGIDPSLTSTGLCGVEVTPEGVQHVSCRVVTSKPPADKSYEAIARRIDGIATTIRASVQGAHTVVIEAPSFSSKVGHTHSRYWLWGKIYDMCYWELDKNVLVVNPRYRMKYVTGKGNAQKDVVLSAAVRRWPEVEFSGNDEADALILAAIGCRSIGMPIDEVPQSYWQPVMAKLAEENTLRTA